MLKIALTVIVAVTLAGCASAREESTIAVQEQLPHLVAACNAFSYARSISSRNAIKACDRLAKERRLSLADPATVGRYHAYKLNRLVREPSSASGMPSTNVPTTPFVCSSLPACP